MKALRAERAGDLLTCRTTKWSLNVAAGVSPPLRCWLAPLKPQSGDGNQSQRYRSS